MQAENNFNLILITSNLSTTVGTSIKFITILKNLVTRYTIVNLPNKPREGDFNKMVNYSFCMNVFLIISSQRSQKIRRHF